MRIVNKAEFYLLPEGTVYAVYEPQTWYGLNVKGEVWKDQNGKDFEFLYKSLLYMVDCQNSAEESDILNSAEHQGTIFKMDYDCYQRDGMFDDNQLYMIYDKEDIRGLIGALEEVVEKSDSNRNIITQAELDHVEKVRRSK
jgi:hypothetical protein